MPTFNARASEMIASGSTAHCTTGVDTAKLHFEHIMEEPVASGVIGVLHLPHTDAKSTFVQLVMGPKRVPPDFETGER
jgi:hypothetical protein